MAAVKNDQIEQQSINTREAPEDEWYDLLPVEKKLIYDTLGLGLILLIVFILAFGLYR
ncbi:MAG: hypothetical protein HPY50_18655 [Firmicutes bacterium]|nr:hypothetical protein [Bacillota bacterium]